MSASHQPQTLFASMAALRTAHGVLLRDCREAGDSPAALDRVEDFLREARLTGAILDREADRTEAQNILDGWTTRLYRGGRDPLDTDLAEFDIGLAPILPDFPSPYIGLDAFGDSETGFFFGREDFIADSIERLQTGSLLAVVGPSGSGKSSIVLAGLVPRLKRGAVAGSETWHYYPRIVPGSEPLRSLAQLCLAGGTRDAEDALIDRLRKDPSELASRLQASGAPGRVILIDQFEEVFTLCLRKDDREAFDANLANAVQVPGNVLILTMRDDYIGQLPQLPLLHPAIMRNMKLAGGLSAAELREAIQKPAQIVGLKFEDGVVDALTRDLTGEPAALPLLQTTLLQLWENRQRNRVTMETYRKVGGGLQALARAANQFYESLPKQEQEIVERILCRLVRPGAGTLFAVARRLRRNDLYAIAPKQVIDPVLQKLVDKRLVRLTKPESPNDAEVEIAHEALIRNWDRLIEWVRRSREQMETSDRLERRAAEWVGFGRGRAGLLDDVSLTIFEQWAAGPEAQIQGYSDDARQFLAASRRNVDRLLRRERLLKLGLAFAASIAIALAITAATFAVSATKRAVEAGKSRDAAKNKQTEAEALAGKNKSQLEELRKQAATINELEAKKGFYYDSDDFASKATAVAASDSDLALLFTLHAATLAYEHEVTVPKNTQDVLRASVRREAALLRLPTHAAVNRVAFSSDAGLIAAAEDGGDIQIWDAFTGKETPIIHFGSKANSVAFSLKGNFVALAGSDGARLLEFPSRKLIAHMTHPKPVHDIAISPNSTVIATACEDGVVRLWDSQGHRIEALPGSGKAVNSVAFSPDARLLAEAGAGHTVHIWRVSTREKVRDLEPPKPPASQAKDGSPETPAGQAKESSPAIRQVAFSPDGVYVLAEDESGERHAWRIQDGNVARYPAEEWSPGAADDLDEFSPGRNRAPLSARVRVRAYSPGRELAVSVEKGDDNKHVLQVWRKHSSTQAVEFDSSPETAVVSEDGRYGLSIAGDKAEVRELPSGKVVSLWQQPHAIQGAISRDGTLMALAGAGVRLARPGQEKQALVLDEKRSFELVAMTPDGTRVAAAGTDGAVTLWNRGGTQLLTASVAASALAIHPSASQLAVGKKDGSVFLLASGSSPRRLAGQHSGPVTSVAFTADGKRLASAGAGGSVLVWDLRSTQSPIKLAGIAGDMSDIRFSPSGRSLALLSPERLKLWEVSPDAILESSSVGSGLGSPNPDPIEFIAVGFTADSSSLITIDAGGRVDTMPVSTEGLITNSLTRLVRGWQTGECDKYLKRSPCPDTVRSLQYVATGNTMARTGDSANALKHYREALRLDPKLPLKPELMVRQIGSEATGIFNAVSSKALQSKGRALAMIGELPAAAEALRAASKRDPNTAADPETTALTFYHNQLSLALRIAIDGVNNPAIENIRESAMHSAASDWEKSKTWATTFVTTGAQQLLAKQPAEAIRFVEAAQGEAPQLTLTPALSISLFDAQVRIRTGANPVDSLRTAITAGNMTQVDSIRQLGLSYARDHWDQGKGWAVLFVETGARQLLALNRISEANQFVEAAKREAPLYTPSELFVGSVFDARLRSSNSRKNVDETTQIVTEGLQYAGNHWDKLAAWAPRFVEAAANQYLGTQYATADWRPAEALRIVEAAQSALPRLALPASLWNTLCWRGSLKGPAEQFKSACETAVRLDSYAGYRDSRAVNRVLLGDFPGAIEDFKFYIASSKDPARVKQRLGYLDKLQHNETPLTPAELRILASQ